MARKGSLFFAPHSFEMIELLREETDRGCVLTASAYLEDAMRQALMAKCRELSDVTDKELAAVFKSFDSHFANFAACIRLARAMGLLKKYQQDMLLKFGPARNAFAHHAGRKTITDAWLCPFAIHVKDLLDPVVESFSQRPELANVREPRLRFMLWASLCHTTLQTEIALIQKRSPR